MKLGKRLLPILLTLSMAASMLPAAALAAEADAGEKHITILGTSDMHGNIWGFSYEDNAETANNGMARLYTYIQQVRAENPNTILIDAGDDIQGTIMTDDLYNKTPEEPHPVIAAMNYMGYDAMTLGNHEFNWGIPTMQTILSQAEFPVLAANVTDADGEFVTGAGWTIVERDGVKVAVIGKPNVGKSSLTNRILGQERVIVSNVAGTTRDAVDSYFENETGKYLIIDTAGMRKKSKVDDRIEKFSVLRATMAIERSDVCLIMIDAQEGVTEQDTKVAGLAHEAGKACIIVVNKWDAIEKDDKTMKRMEEEVRRDLSYMTYAPILFISAMTGQRVDRLFQVIQNVVNQATMRIPTGVLNSVLADAQTRVQPPTDKGRRLKIYYMTQVGVKPPHFVIFCNDAKLFHFSYQRYIENQIRATFGLVGTPVRITIRQKGDKEE